MTDTRPLSERLLAAVPGVPAFAALLREAAALAARVEAAPVVEVKAAGTDGACRVYAITTPEALAAAPPLVFRRVALVEVPE